jgi:lysophospholipase L1-like esterase
MIKRFMAAGIKPVLCTLSVIGESSDPFNEFNEELDVYSDVIRKLATENDFPVIDLRKAFVAYNLVNNPNNLEQGILTADTVHLNNTGNQLVADEMWKVLQHC